MNAILTFVTARVSLEFLNKVLKDCHYDIIDKSIFSLIQAPHQTTFDVPGTEPPVDPSFSSIFIGSSLNELWNTHREMLEEDAKEKATHIDSRFIAEIDEKSEAHTTIMMHFKDEEEGQQASWRVPIKYSAVLTLDSLDEWDTYSQPEMVGEDGTLDVRKVRKTLQSIDPDFERGEKDIQWS